MYRTSVSGLAETSGSAEGVKDSILSSLEVAFGERGVMKVALVLLHYTVSSDHGVSFSHSKFLDRCRHLVHRFVGEQTACILVKSF